MEPHFFATLQLFANGSISILKRRPNFLVGFYKINSGKPSVTWPESVDQALCYGWIDGVRKSLAEDSYTIRFTPRKPTSIWSAINIDKMESLLKQGLVKPAGIAAYEKRTEDKSRIYSHERKEDAVLPAGMEKEFKANKSAWEFFTKQAPSYQKTMLHLIVSAKQAKTRRSRFEKLLNASAEGKGGINFSNKNENEKDTGLKEAPGMAFLYISKMKIVRKINTLDDALSVFEQSAIEHGEATKEGNFKVGNKAYDRMIKAVSFIRANGSNTDLLPFLEHTDINTRISAAAFIIHDHQQQAVSVLEEVRNRNDIFAHTANLVLSQWKAGRLSL